MRRSRGIGLLTLALALAFASGEGLRADRLVLKDGTELETVGAWEIQGRLVVFTRPGGTLASIRATEVDLEKSVAATTAANTPVPPPPPPPKKASVLSLTEKDLPPIGEGGAETGGAAAAGAAASGLVVLPGWRTVVAADGQSTEVLGSVRNDAQVPMRGVQVVAILISSEGEILAEIEGAASSRALQPGQTSSFRVGFENGQPYERIELRVNGESAAEPSPPAAPPAEVETSDAA